MNIKCVVACHDGDGPNFYFVKVDCTKEQYDNGEHYEAAEGIIRENYDVDGPFWVCDENDYPVNFIISNFPKWETADVTCVD